MKNSASTSCGSVKISFYTYPTEAKSSPINSINRSARLSLISLLGADGAAFAILHAAALSPSEAGVCRSHVLTRAPPPRATDTALVQEGPAGLSGAAEDAVM